MAPGWPFEIDVSIWCNHLPEHPQDIAQKTSTLPSFDNQSCFLAWLAVEILDGRPCSAWDRHPDPAGGRLLYLFHNFQHTLLPHEIVASFQCQPLGIQPVPPRMMCDGALRMAAHLPDTNFPDARSAANAAAAAAAAAAATAATAVGAGRGVRGAAGACGS